MFYRTENAMAINRETLSIVQVLTLIDKDGIRQSQLVIYNSPLPPHGQGQKTQRHGCRHGGHTQGLIRPSDRENLGNQSSASPYIRGPWILFWIRPAIYAYDRTID